jgi:hypothetical protein
MYSEPFGIYGMAIDHLTISLGLPVILRLVICPRSYLDLSYHACGLGVWVFGCFPRGLGWLHSLGFRMASPAWRGFIRQHFSQQIRQVGYGDFYPETLAGYIVVSMLTFVSVPPACKQAALRPKRRFNQHGKLESEGKK